MKKSLRAGKVFVDWSQNDRHKTTVNAYSLRAMDRPTVSTPLSWDEVEEIARTGVGVAFTSDEVLARVAEKGDLFAPVQTLEQTLPH
jgi:bifunctional non-homologous end joining protein LigD